MNPNLRLNQVGLLQHRVRADGSLPVFRIPKSRGPEPCQEWTTVTFAEYGADVNRVAHWLNAEMEARDVPPGSVVSVWFSGFDYAHFVYIMALCRALYVPQAFSLSLTDAGVVSDLMGQANSKAIVYDPSLEPLLALFPFPKLATVPITSIPGGDGRYSLPDIPASVDRDEICFIYHTSGSTSGSPKLVPIARKAIKGTIEKQAAAYRQGGPFTGQNVMTQLGSFCHAATLFQFFEVLNDGACFVQPSKPRFSPEELTNMVEKCGLNRITMFGPFVSMHVRAAKQDSEFLKLLQSMRTISYGGASLPVEDDEWCFRNGVPLVNIYANTESGVLMASKLGESAHHLYPLPGSSYRFDPVGETSQLDTSESVQLLEFVILADSQELAKSSLVGEDGHFHTGDLFERQKDGSYIFRGRDDDWIKDETTKRCDTKAIEEKVRETCDDLIKDCVVVGNQRPSVALFVEVLGSNPTSEDGLKETILGRMKDFNSRRYTHERVTDKRLIMVISDGILPRTTKGNLRRRAIEQAYAKELDAAYASVYGR